MDNAADLGMENKLSGRVRALTWLEVKRDGVAELVEGRPPLARPRRLAPQRRKTGYASRAVRPKPTSAILFRTITLVRDVWRLDLVSAEASRRALESPISNSVVPSWCRW